MKTPKKLKTAGMKKSISALVSRVETLQDRALTLSRAADPVVAKKFDDIEGYMNDAAAALYFAVEALESLEKKGATGAKTTDNPLSH